MAERRGTYPDEAGERAPEGARRHGTSLSALARASRLARSTLRYYEKVGILEPEDIDSSGTGDPGKKQSRLGWVVSLKNLGYSVEEIKEFVDDDPFNLANIRLHRSNLQRKISYLQAQDESIALFEKMLTRCGTTWIEEVETFLIDFHVPTGDIRDEERGGSAQEAPMYMPVSGGVGLFRGDDPLHPEQVLWGRGVLRRHAAVIEGFPDDLTHMGGQTCVCRSVLTEEMPSLTGPDAWLDELAGMADHARSNGHEPCGAAFVPCYFANKEGVYVLLCLPVRKRSRLPHRLALGKQGRRDGEPR